MGHNGFDTAAEEFEQYLQRIFVGKKRFGAEGAEGMLPWFDALLARSAALGVQEVIIGGTARGRLNVMANVIGNCEWSPVSFGRCS